MSNVNVIELETSGDKNMGVFFVLYSDTSQNSFGGLHPKVTLSTDEQTIAAAEYELRRAGEDLEDLAGIEWIEDEDGNLTRTRSLTHNEVVSLSLHKLNDDGRLYVRFSDGDEFVEHANRYGVGAKARALVESL